MAGLPGATSSFATGSPTVLGGLLPLYLGFPVADERANGITMAIRVQNPASSSTAMRHASILRQPPRL